MLAHLFVQLLYAGAIGALFVASMGNILPWWAYGGFLIMAALVDVLWHSWNHHRWITDSFPFSVWIGAAAAVLLFMLNSTGQWQGLLLLYAGQIVWDLSWHSYHHHKALWTNSDILRITAMLMIIIGLGVSTAR